MSRIVAVENLSLDGVMQAPGRPDEDTRDGFAYGGWAVPYADEVALQVMGRSMAETEALLLGRRTYQDFFGFWPHQTDNPFTEVLNKTQKYVASRTLAEPLPWQNSTLLTGDVPAAVAELKARPGGDIVVLGSGELVRSLIPHHLVDRYALSIHPLVLGAGRRLFPDAGVLARYRLVDSVTATTGVIIATYEVA